MTDPKPTIIRFSDGTSFDVSGPHRIVRKSDGLYVIGHVSRNFRFDLASQGRIKHKLGP
jgi:hypothetical protein